jgi:hypothetical protein
LLKLAADRLELLVEPGTSLRGQVTGAVAGFQAAQLAVPRDEERPNALVQDPDASGPSASGPSATSGPAPRSTSRVVPNSECNESSVKGAKTLIWRDRGL